MREFHPHPRPRAARLVITLCALIVAGHGLRASAMDREAAETARREAASLIMDGNYNMAAEVLRELHNALPDDQRVLFDLVAVLSWSERFQESADLSSEYLVIRPPQYSLAAAAIAHRRVGNYDMADALYRDGQARYPGDPEFYVGQIHTLADAGRFDDSDAAARTCRDRFGDIPELAEALAYRDGKRSEAEFVRRWDEAAAAAREGDYDRAIADLRTLKAERPDEKGIDNDILAVLSWAGRHREAADMANALPLETAPAYTRRAAALSLREAGDLAGAERQYRGLLEEDPDDAETAEGLAMALILQDRIDDAERLIDEYKSPDEPERMAFAQSLVVAARRDQAAELGRSGRHDEALANLRELKRKRPGHIGVDHDILTILYWAGRHREAAEEANRLDIDSAPSYVRHAAAFSLREAGELEKAASLYRALLEEEPGDAELAEALALTLIRDNRLREAEEVIDSHKDPADPGRMAASERLLVATRRDQAADLGRQGHYDEALGELRDLKAARPGYAGIDHDILAVLTWAERYRDAAELAATLDLEAAPEYVRQAAALAFRASGDSERAERLYRGLPAANPEDAAPQEAKVMALLDSGLLREAQEAAEGVPLSPEGEEALVAAWREQAAVLGREGRHDEALATLAEALGHYPDNSGLLDDNLAILSWAGRNADVIARGAGIDADSAPEYAVAAVANAYRKEGRPDEALPFYEKGMARFPANPDFAAGMAMVLGDLGEPERALSLLDEFSRNHPGADQTEITSARTYVNPPAPYVPRPRPDAPYRAEQDAIVARAREGAVDQAVKDMEALYAAHPDDQHLLGDLIVVRQWSRDNMGAIDLAKRLNLTLVHDYVAGSVMRAMMAAGDHYQAQEFLAQVLKAQQGNAELMVFAASILARAGDVDKALEYLDLAENSRHPGIGNRVAEARKAMGLEFARNAADLEESNRLLAADGGSPEARRLRASGLNGVRALRLGKDELADGDAVLMPPEFTRANNLAAAERLNSWGEETSLPRDNNVRADQYFRALDEDARLQDRSSREDDIATWVLAGASKIKSYYGMGMFCEAVAEYEAIREISVDTGTPIPDGALLDAAGAYLGARRPAAAKCLYLELLARKTTPVLPPEAPVAPRWEDLYEARKGLFWALLENEELNAALYEAEEHFREGATPDAEAATPGAYRDITWQKPDLHVTRGLARLYTNFMAEADERLTELVAKEPANAGALAALASTKSMRGLPRTANDLVRLAQIHAPSDIGLATQEAGNYLATQDWRKAYELLKVTMPYYSQVGSVQRLQRDWETFNLRELRVDVAWSRTVSGGDNSNSNSGAGGGGVPSLEARLFSSPICYNWRVFGGAATSSGDFVEGHARQNIYLGGVEYRDPRLTAVLEARADQVHDFEIGLELSGVYTPDDHWRFPFSFQRTSRDTPLRARHNGINGHSASAGASYVWNESRSVNSSLGYLGFTDGNRRFSFGGDFNQRLWTCFTHYIDGQINTYASRNSLDANRPYFNPKFDWELGAAITYGDVLWRCYERLWSHAATVGAGNYYQRYYGSGLVWSINYSQTLTLSDRFTMTYGAGYGRRIYDGVPERTLNAFLSLNWRF